MPSGGHELLMTILGVVLGGILSILTTVFIENLRRPKLRLKLALPSDSTYGPNHPLANRARYLNVDVENVAIHPLLRWISRSAAMQCIGSITFHNLYGADIFGRAMEARWGETVQPVYPAIFLDNQQAGYLADIERIRGISHVDIFEGRKSGINVAVKFDAEAVCWGWSNQSYFSNPQWRDGKWKMEKGTYLVRVIVHSAGAEARNVFRLVNEAGLDSFRLEEATDAEREKVEAQSGA